LADRGDVSAQAELGSNYYLGQGVTQNFSEAEHWLRLAAEQGDSGAQFKLGSLYSRGQGLPEDYVKAYKWYTIAATSRHAKAAENRNKVGKNMTPSQIAEAQRLLQDFVAHRMQPESQ